MISPRSVSVWQQVKLSDVSLGTGLRYSLVAKKEFKKPTKKNKKNQAPLVVLRLQQL